MWVAIIERGNSLLVLQCAYELVDVATQLQLRRVVDGHGDGGEATQSPVHPPNCCVLELDWVAVSPPWPPAVVEVSVTQGN